MAATKQQFHSHRMCLIYLYEAYNVFLHASRLRATKSIDIFILLMNRML